MEYMGRTPAPPLDAFVERVWYCSATVSDAVDHVLPARARVLPGGGAVDFIISLLHDDIKIHAADDPALVRAHSGAFVAGSNTRPFLVDPGRRVSVVGVHFRPGGAFPFLGISPSEIVDAHVPLDELWGSAGSNLREQLFEAGSASERLRVVEAALLARLRRARPGHPAVRAAIDRLRSGGDGAHVARVAAAAGLSHRRFVEVFEREVGLTPKLFSRLQRFHRVKQRLAALAEPPAWAEFALDCGYFDQSHLIREFTTFSGISAASYLKSRYDETMFDHLVHAYPGRPGAVQPERRR